MTGLTITMAPAVEPSSSFKHSSSTSDLMGLPSFDFEQTIQHKRSHSGNDLSPTQSSFDLSSFDNDFSLDTSIFANNRLASPPRPSTTTRAEQTYDRPAKHATARVRTGSILERPRSWFPSSKPTKRVAQDELERPMTSVGEDHTGTWPTQAPEQRPVERSLGVSDSFANFAKRSWIASSNPRSTSPKGRQGTPGSNELGRDDVPKKVTPNKGKAAAVATAATATSAGTTVDEAEQSRPADPVKPAPTALNRASTYLAKMKQKQPMGFAKFSAGPDSDNSCASSATSLAPPSNNDALASKPTSFESSTNTDESAGEVPPQTRDRLWSSFKTLETELKSFLTKQTGQRIAQLQATVLPFLRGTANHASTKTLRPEDVDRRAAIFNKWWIAALDMLEGQPQQQPVAGVDRPVLLEAATMIMMRPEWRQLTTSFQPLSERTSPESRRERRSWTTSSASSINSGQADFLAESSEHNVRTMFVSNLMRQTGIVVDKLSLRHAPASLISFAGKTCAYAFFFAPGIADILVRLWALNPDLIRRASDELGLPRRDRGESEETAAAFPSCVGEFAWTSPKGMWEMLKQTHQLPMAVARIPWTGPWVTRWKGNDTDLFFIFCKYFYILSDQFVRPGVLLSEKAKAPGFALVQAQILGLLDTTIHRQAAAVNAFGQPSLLDSMQGPDASAMAMPRPPNLSKGMSENRLVLLLRDFLSEDLIECTGARHTFAEAFSSVVKAATRKTSQFDNSACFTLCDFAEEVLAVFGEWETPAATAAYMDWDFWIDVWKRILGSLNTMSEIRVLALVFAIWDKLAQDPRRKERVCLDWLLREDVFDTFFNHWCPMVRAYYHRLLCWRICRDEGSANESDTVFLVVATRLKTVWAHYLYLKQTAEEAGRCPPFTAPMLPTPGKKFMIIRQEVNTPQPGLFIGLDSSARTSLGDPIATEALTEGDVLVKNDAKKRWSLLGKVLAFTGAGSASVAPASGVVASSTEDDLQSVRRETAEARSTRPGPVVPPKMNLSNEQVEAHSGASSPVYDEPKHVFKFFLGWLQTATPPRERILTRPRLPAPSQARVSVRARSGTPPPPPPGMPTPGRVQAGAAKAGRVPGAKKTARASAPGVGELAPRPFVSFSQLGEGVVVPSLDEDEEDDEDDEDDQTPTQTSAGLEVDLADQEARERVVELTVPVKPTGIFAKNAVYTGRALAEWAQVVFECNAFVDRRREEGVLGLSEVEVPLMGVEGFRNLRG